MLPKDDERHCFSKKMHQPPLPLYMPSTKLTDDIDYREGFSPVPLFRDELDYRQKLPSRTIIN